MLNVNLIASSAAGCKLSTDVALSDHIVAKEGFCVAVQALGTNPLYNKVEAADGAFHAIEEGVRFVGVLGSREALKGFRGHTPTAVAPGDTLHLLNMGGILGLCTAEHPELGHPIKVKVLGAVADPGTENGQPLSIQSEALNPLLNLPQSAPIIAVCGTAMDTGKTVASAELVKGLTSAGFKVAAAKLTGAALLRDVRRMKDHGATAVGTFAECGLVSSTGRPIVPYAKAVLGRLNEAEPDLIVVELGDGFIGPYGVDQFLLDRELARHTAATVVTATDLAGAWAAVKLYSERYRRPITAFAGPVTDNAVGTDYIRKSLGVPAYNAKTDGDKLTAAVLRLVVERRPSKNKSQAAVAS